MEPSARSALTETMQSQRQEGYTITALPGQATTTTGGATGSSAASGDASAFSTYDDSWASDDSYGSGYSYASGDSGTSGYGGQDHYADQSSWSAPYDALWMSSSGASSSDHVWGSGQEQWAYGSWWQSQYPNSDSGSGSGSGGGSGSGVTVNGGSSATAGSSPSSYDQQVWYAGFQGGQYDYGYYGSGPYDGGWSWGQGGYGLSHTGPLGPSAFSGVGYVFTPGDPVSVADVADQSATEGDAVSLQIHASDWASGSGGGMEMGSGDGWSSYSASGLPAGLGIDNNGLISGTVLPGDAANGPYDVTVSYTDNAGNTASQSFTWDVADPVTVTDPGSQSAVEGTQVSLQLTGGDGIAGAAPLTYSAVGLPAGLTMSSTGLISGTVAAGDAANGPYDVTVTASDGVYSATEEVALEVAAAAPPAASGANANGGPNLSGLLASNAAGPDGNAQNGDVAGPFQQFQHDIKDLGTEALQSIKGQIQQVESAAKHPWELLPPWNDSRQFSLLGRTVTVTNQLNFTGEKSATGILTFNTQKDGLMDVSLKLTGDIQGYKPDDLKGMLNVQKTTDTGAFSLDSTFNVDKQGGAAVSINTTYQVVSPGVDVKGNAKYTLDAGLNALQADAVMTAKDVQSTASLNYDFATNKYTVDFNGVLAPKDADLLKAQLGIKAASGNVAVGQNAFSLKALGTVNFTVGGGKGHADASVEFDGRRFNRYGLNLYLESKW